MPFFTDLASAVANNLLSNAFLGGSSSSSDPFRVLEISSSRYASRPILLRELSVALYGPGAGTTMYEIVLNKPLHAGDYIFSLLRTQDKDEAFTLFHAAQACIPLIVDLAPEFLSASRLQNLWNLIREHPTWTSCHVAAHYGVLAAVANPVLKELFNARDAQTGVTPLHVAAQEGKHAFLKAVISLSLDISYNAVDFKGNNLYHYAAQANKETVEVLSFCGLENINDCNKDGQTPLHLACLSDKPECVKALMASGADVNTAGSEGLGCAVHIAAATSCECAREIIKAFPNQLHAKDMKFGGTPLHWATSKDVTVSLIEFGCRIDARNFTGASALHVMVQRERFDCVVALLMHDADPNLPDNDGNTPLHMASTAMNLPIVQALIVFGADVNAVNKKGETARHIAAIKRHSNQAKVLYALHAVGGLRCSPNASSCADGCSVHGNWDGKSAGNDLIPRSRYLFDDMLAAKALSGASPSDSTKGGRLLCLDGGGIRGLVLIQMLQLLESALQQPIIESFDWIAGTSTGGILALALASGKSLAECRKLYFRLKDKVFVGKRPYDSDMLEKFLQDEFGQQKFMVDLTHPKLIVTALLADKCPADLHLFRNYTAPQDLLHLPEASSSTSVKKPEQQLVWQAARATGAAPTYFRAVGSYLDGGLVANNPTLDLLTEIHEYNLVMETLGRTQCVVKPKVLLSLGTGCRPTEVVNTIDLFRPESLLDTARLALGMSAFGKLLVEQVTSSDRRVVDRARSWCSSIGVAYLRLSPCFTQEIAIDEVRDEVLVQMLWETRAYFFSHQLETRKLLELLKNP